MWWQYHIIDATAPSERTTELNAMLIVAHKKFRIRAAIAVTLLYAVCILAPSAAFAFAPPGAAAHCLTEPLGAAHVPQEQAVAINDVQARGGKHIHSDDVQASGGHIHSDAGMPDQHSDADGKKSHGNCCGLFCVTAMTHEAAPALAAPPAAPLIGPGQDFQLAGRGPDRINRPPIA